MRIYLTNLGKYNEGKLVGQWVELPVNEEELKEVKKVIGISERYEEWFITDWEESPLEINEYDNVSMLNQIAQVYEEMTEEERVVLEFMLKYEGIEWENALEIISNYDYICYEDIKDEYDLGKRITEDWEIPQRLEYYINYEQIGFDSEYDEGWTIYKEKGILLFK